MTYLLQRWIHNSRCYSTSIPRLPPESQWNVIFKAAAAKTRSQRFTLSNPEIATRLAQSILSTHCDGLTVIEAFPGLGTLTRALLKLPRVKIKKLIVLEDNPTYYEHLKKLEKCDDRIVIFNRSAIDWDTYSVLEEEKLIGERQDWDAESRLHFICQLPHRMLGEQFFNQIVRLMPVRGWLFQYARMPMHILMVEALFNKFSAARGTLKYSKLSVMADAITELTLPMDSELMQPYKAHFWPRAPNSGPKTTPMRQQGQPVVAISLLPKIRQIIEPNLLDKWDYVLRQLFILKKTSLRKALPQLAPGAKVLESYLEGPDVPPENTVDLNTIIVDLTLDDWGKIIKAFDRWPFAPDDLRLV